MKSGFERIEAIVDNAIQDEIQSGEISKISVSDLTTREISLLADKRILPQGSLREIKGLKLYAHKDLKTFILINYNDHLTVYSFAPQDSIKAPWKKVNSIIKKFDDTLFTKDEKGNYYTSDLSFFGTGFKIYLAALLPYIRFKDLLNPVLESLEQNSYIYKLMFDIDDADDIILITNRSSFDCEPEYLIKKTEQLCKSLIGMETIEKRSLTKSELELIKNTVRDIIKKEKIDKVDILEFYYYSVLARNENIYEKLSVSKLNSSLLQLQEGHLNFSTNKVNSQKSLNHLRAVKLRERFLKKINLG